MVTDSVWLYTAMMFFSEEVLAAVTELRMIRE